MNISKALKVKSILQKKSPPPGLFVRIELNALYPERLPFFVSSNQVSLSTMISGFLFNPSIYGAHFQPFLFNDLVSKLEINKSLKKLQSQLKEA